MMVNQEKLRTMMDTREESHIMRNRAREEWLLKLVLTKRRVASKSANPSLVDSAMNLVRKFLSFVRQGQLH
jgi:hypothetical protein